MKTNNVLTRPMGDFSVNQRTNDGSCGECIKESKKNGNFIYARDF